MNRSPVETTLAGVVVNKRKVSKKLAFFDLESADGTITELCIKAGPALSEVHVKDIRDDIKVGDTVVSRGHADPKDLKVIILSSIAVTTRWKDEHPGEHYVPRCALTASKHTDRKASQVCKFHINGGCHKGDVCPYMHVDLAAAPSVRQSWIAERKKVRKQAAAEKGHPHGGSAAKKSARTAVLAQWLVDTYGAAFLGSGTGVVDVAGGRGSLSFALQVQHGVTCTVVDPRPPKPTKEQLRFLQQLSGRAACPQDLPMQPGQGQRKLPEHIQAAFDEDLWSGPQAQRLHAASLIVGLHPDQATDSIVGFAVRRGKPFAVVPCCVFPRLFRHRRMAPAAQTREAEDSGSAEGAVEGMHRELNHSSPCSLPSSANKHHKASAHSIHPHLLLTSRQFEVGGPLPRSPTDSWLRDGSAVDQATEHVDGEGEAVVTHEQLVTYLQHIGGPHACIARLPFDGMNTVVYRLPWNC